MPNRLAKETSPYLQQHADNPVDWYPWGEEALQRARREDKPILLSVGYSACHWCHVMAHESFEDPEVAAVMNRLFVNIKVDREERPDLDQIYQTAHALLVRRNGGWPLTMFLTPDGKPFFGGTYFPKSARYGMPGFVDVLEQVAQAWHTRRSDINAQNASLIEVLESTLPGPASQTTALMAEPIDGALTELLSTADEVYGGFGAAPKFPHPTELSLGLRFGDRAPRLRDHVLFTLEKMAEGGLFDQLGGGFYRYSVDAQWSIPHFEKMLYDNGPLLGLYVDAWLLTGNPLFRRVAEQTAGWVMREMQSPEGGYYSSLDADSEHEEGKFYVWSREEARERLSADEYAIAAASYGLGGSPNFEGRHWHLQFVRPLRQVAESLGLDEARAQERLDRARGKLFAARERRVRPGRDEKILVSWNALMIEGMAHAGRALKRPDWVQSARRALQFISSRMRQGSQLLATYKDGRAHLNAYLDDYAFLASAVLELLQGAFDVATLRLATELADAMLERFEDSESGGFHFTSHDHERLILRPKPGHDGATPSGNGVGAQVLARLGHVLGEARYTDAAERAVRVFYSSAERHPSGFASILIALAEVLQPTRTLVLRGSEPAVSQWLSELSGEYRPDTLVLAIANGGSALPAVLDKPMPADGGVNAYLCQGVSCSAPVSELARLKAMFSRGTTVPVPDSGQRKKGIESPTRGNPNPHQER